VSPAILLVPVEPVPPGSTLAGLAARLEEAFGREVRVTAPLSPPAASRLSRERSAAEPVRAAVAAAWGCGCRERIVGVTSAAVEGTDRGAGCGSVLVVGVADGDGLGEAVRAVGRSLGLGDCPDPGCAMHPGGDAPGLCRSCRERS
jgi:hypothetical protein